MIQLGRFVKVPLLLSAIAVAAMLTGGIGAKAQGWHDGYGGGGGGGYYHHNGWHEHYHGDYYNGWHHQHSWGGPVVALSYGPSYHYHNWGHRRYYWYNGNRWYLNLNTGIRVEL